MKLRLLALLVLIGFGAPSYAQNCIRALWVKKFGSTSTDLFQEMCADSGRLSFTTAGQFGTTITIGSTTLSNATGRGYFIARFDTSGAPVMAALVGHCTATVGNVIETRQLETDNAGNVYISGYYSGAVTLQGNAYTGSSFGTFFVAKFSATGSPLWVRTVNNGSRSFAHGLAVDDVTGAVYIAGGFEGQTITLDNITLTNKSTSSPFNGDAFIACLNTTSGQFVWAENFGTTNGDVAYSLALDGLGGLFVSGNFGQGAASLSSTVGATAPRTTWNFYVAKFSTGGVAQWVNIIHAGGTSEQMVSWQATCDEAGNCYIAGECNGTYLFGNAITITTMSTSQDAFLAKFRNDGQCAWVRLGSTTATFEAATDVDYYQGKLALCGAVSGNYPVFGNISVPVGSTKTFSSVCDTSGNFIWARTYCTSSSASAAGTLFDATGAVYTCGQFTQSETWYPVTIAPSGPYDAYVVKFKSSASATPVVNAGPDHTTSCATTVTLSGSSVSPVGTNYQWRGPNGFAATILSPGVAPGTTAAYILTGIYQGCIDTDTSLVTVSPNSTSVNAGADVAVCSGNSTTLNASSVPGGATFAWTPVAGLSSSTVANPVATPVQTTDYVVTATNGGCTSTDTVRVTVNQNPFLNVAPSFSTCQGSPVNITAGSPQYNYTWTPPTGLSSTTSYSVTATPTTSQIYTVTASTTAGCTNSMTFTFTVTNNNPAPVVGTQPSNVTICAGNSVSFSTSATNSVTVNYRWEMNTGSGWVLVPTGAPYSNVATATLLVNPVTAAMNGYQFRCRISSVCSPVVYSNTVTLTISSSPGITTQPPNRSICPGNNTTFPLTASGTGNTYQWQVDFGSGFVNLTNTPPYSGVTLTTLSITNATAGMNGYQYRCIITGCSPAAATTSDTALLSVGQPPIVLSQPVNDTVCTGSSVTFGLTESGATAYGWQYYNGSTWVNLTNTAPYSGVTTSTLSINPVSPALVGVQYRCRIFGGCSTISISDTVSFALLPGATVISSPSNATTCPGDSISFVTNGTNATNYQWEVNTGSGFVVLNNIVPYSGVNTATLNIDPVTANMNGYQYRCIITDVCSSTATTAAATLTISAGPAVQIHPQDANTCAASSASFSVSANNTTSYQWEVNNGSGWTALANSLPYSGVTSSLLNINPVNAGMNNYQYRCIVVGSCGFTDTSNAAALFISPGVTINTEPVNDTTCIGSNAVFQVSAAHAVNYQWQENNGSGWSILNNSFPYSGTNTAMLIINPVSTAMNGYMYRCVATNTCGVDVASDSALIVFGTSVSVLSHPSAYTACENDTAVFSCSASGAVSYQWEADLGSGFFSLSNNAVYSGVTTNQLTISGVAAVMNGGFYRCIVTGCNGSDTTFAAPITVNALPNVTLAPFTTVCINWSAVTLSGGSPAGGVYTGPGVSAGIFDPGLAGAGTHTVVYTYSDANGCTDTAQQQITVDLCTGIDQESASGGIRLFPNPAMSSATLMLGQEGVNTNYTIEVLSSQGQVLSSQQETVNGKSNVEMSFRNFAKGVYFIRVRSDSGIQTIRLVLI